MADQFVLHGTACWTLQAKKSQTDINNIRTGVKAVTFPGAGLIKELAEFGARAPMKQSTQSRLWRRMDSVPIPFIGSCGGAG